MKAQSKIIKIGSKILVRFGDGDIETLRIVHAGDENLSASHISMKTPFAQAVLNRHEGEKVSYCNYMDEIVVCAIDKILS